MRKRIFKLLYSLFLAAVTLISCDTPLIEPKLELNPDPKMQESLDRREEEVRGYATFTVGEEGNEDPCANGCVFTYAADEKTHHKECIRCGKLGSEPEEHKKAAETLLRDNSVLMYDVITLRRKIYISTAMKCSVCKLVLPSEFSLIDPADYLDPILYENLGYGDNDNDSESQSETEESVKENIHD